MACATKVLKGTPKGYKIEYTYDASKDRIIRMKLMNKKTGETETRYFKR